MQALIAARTWLTVIRLPAYASDLNPAEGVWRWMKRGLTNIAARGVDHLGDLAAADVDRPHPAALIGDTGSGLAEMMSAFRQQLIAAPPWIESAVIHITAPGEPVRDRLSSCWL